MNIRLAYAHLAHSCTHLYVQRDFSNKGILSTLHPCVVVIKALLLFAMENIEKRQDEVVEDDFFPSETQ